ncbi:MAG: hypothetical protein JXM70_07485 [Pirellulales bacterium]|nr:hypothetical protein [Pirellulales bacterium]
MILPELHGADPHIMDPYGVEDLHKQKIVSPAARGRMMPYCIHPVAQQD